jgi:hypothetical protein
MMKSITPTMNVLASSSVGGQIDHSNRSSRPRPGPSHIRPAGDHDMVVLVRHSRICAPFYHSALAVQPAIWITLARRNTNRHRAELRREDVGHDHLVIDIGILRGKSDRR